jgi:hypothetical protein
MEYDKRPIEQPHRRVIGPSLDQMIVQIPIIDGNPRKLTVFFSNIRKILLIFGEECEPYLMYLQNKIIGRVVTYNRMRIFKIPNADLKISAL